jgi:hypothetical protein
MITHEFRQPDDTRILRQDDLPAENLGVERSRAGDASNGEELRDDETLRRRR